MRLHTIDEGINMKDEYDFSAMKSRRNPYASKLKNAANFSGIFRYVERLLW